MIWLLEYETFKLLLGTDWYLPWLSSDGGVGLTEAALFTLLLFPCLIFGTLFLCQAPPPTPKFGLIQPKVSTTDYTPHRCPFLPTSLAHIVDFRGSARFWNRPTTVLSLPHISPLSMASGSTLSSESSSPPLLVFRILASFLFFFRMISRHSFPIISIYI